MKTQTLKLAIQTFFVSFIFLVSNALYGQSPGGVSSGLYLWTKADAGVTATGSQVSQWANQAITTTMTTQASRTASANVTLENNTFNYNPTLVFDGVSNQMLQGQFASPSSNPALIFAVVQHSSTTENSLGGVYSLGGEGASGIVYDPNANGYSVDAAGGNCSPTSDVRGTPGIIRVDYNSASTTAGAFSAFNGKESGACGGLSLNAPDGSFQIGGRTWGNTSLNSRIHAGRLAEVAHYDINSLPNGAVDVKKIESYLAIKYGITLDKSGGGSNGDYLSSDGNTIWDASDDAGAYHNQVIGIGRDIGSGLNQKQSHQVDDKTRLYIGPTLAASNDANTGTIPLNNFVVIGNNGGQMKSTGSTEYPSGLNIFSRIDREWKITKSGTPAGVFMDITLGASPINAADLVLLVDDNGNFSDGGTTSFANATGLEDVMSVSGSTVTIKVISTITTAGGANYITLASTSSNTPLPIELGDLTAFFNGDQLMVDWKTISETNNDHFIIEASKDGKLFL
ncbi:hypothetical protein [Niabella ginsengisoli]|uniref:DUF8202 domain-containing protein n=1 Tax=Niabella ginsengisoli TaxID=522298 RepID=A0ABS9SGG5_9BACT|nr:hypothetical protein [Niabella ginsengisoli]MCH5597457.1 hypothetical protein [Niabella ginsengisoli]